MIKISACLISGDEEKVIGRCLESLRGAVDEIIFIHDGPCADKTLTIAESFGAKIFTMDKKGEAEFHRPFSFRQASGDWILQIDADEFLSSDLRDNLRKLAEAEDVAGYEFLWPYWRNGKQVTKKWPHKRCFFRRDRLSFLGIPHFIPEIEGRVEKKDYILEHRPFYDNYSWASFYRKWIPWAKVQAKCCLQSFSETDKFNYQSHDWPLAIRLRLKFPALLLLPDFFYGFIKSFWSGRRENAFFLLTFSLFIGCYRFLTDYYIFKFKK